MLFSTSKEISFPLDLKNAVRMSEQFFILQVSAAEGAEEFYITSNNHTRMEPVEQARKLDRITQQVSCNVSVKSKLQHATPRAFDFFENYCSNSPLPRPKCHSNAPH